MIHLLEKAGELKLLQCQDTVYLTLARIRYIPDFKVFNILTQEEEWIEAKGYISERWPTIKKLWAFYGPGKLTVYGGTYLNPKIIEVIMPKVYQSE